MEFLLSVALGIGLSAACGFRVFVPLLGISIASLTGHLNLSPGFAWIGTWQACAAFATATLLEILAYYVPYIDNLLDSVAGPAAVIAGTVVMATLVTDIHPFLKWTLAIIAGGGTAAVFQGSTTLLRLTSTAATAGTGNFFVSTIETAISIALTIVAVLLPLVAGIIMLTLAVFVLKRWTRQRLARTTNPGKSP